MGLNSTLTLLLGDLVSLLLPSLKNDSSVSWIVIKHSCRASRASGRDVNRQLMGMFSILFFFPEGRTGKFKIILLFSFSFIIFLKGVVRRDLLVLFVCLFFMQRGLGQKLQIASELGCMSYTVCVLILSVFSTELPPLLFCLACGSSLSAIYKWGSASIHSPQSTHEEWLQGLPAALQFCPAAPQHLGREGGSAGIS